MVAYHIFRSSGTSALRGTGYDVTDDLPKILRLSKLLLFIGIDSK